MFQKYIQNNLENLQFNFLTIIISLLIAPLFASIFGKYLYFSQKYSEFTVGTITFLGVSKNADYMIMIGLAVGFVLTFVFLNKVLNRLEEHEKDKFNTLALYSMVPAAIWFGSLFFTKELSLDLLILSSTLLILLVVVYSFVIKKSDEVFVYSILGTFFMFLSVLGLHIFLNRYSAQSSQWLLSFQNPYLSLKFFKYFSVIFILNVLIYCKFFDYKKYILLISQIFIPLIFMMLIPAAFLKDSTAIQIYPIDKNLYIFVGVLIFISYVFYTRKFFNNGLKIWDYVPTSNALAILFLLKSTITNIPFVSVDDYHFGEFLLPYWSLIKFHSLPFVDLVPARGLINYIDGFLATLFFDLKASYFQYIYNFLLLFYIAILFCIVRVYFGFIVAFFVTFLFSTWNLGVAGIDIFNTVLLLILFFSFLSKNHKKFLILSLVIVTISILFAPGQGGILLLSFLPFITYAFYQLFMKNKKDLLKFSSIVLLIYLIIILSTPLFDMLLGAFQYAVEQSSLNSITYGIPWYFSVKSFANGNYWLFEIVRSSYIFIIGLSAVFILKMIGSSHIENKKEIFVFAMIVFITAMLFIVRGGGRIDPGAFSRLGIASTWIIGVLLPLFLYFLVEKKKYIYFLLPIITYISFYSYLWQGISINNLVAKVTLVQTYHPAIKDGKDFGLDGLGVGLFDETHIQRIQKIKKFLNNSLDKNDTFLNLTNRNALYFYLNRKPPIETGAFYNLISDGQQERAIARLQVNPPKIAILEADNLTHDGLNPALRSHLLYRFVIQNYQPIEIDGIIYGIRNDLFKGMASDISPAQQVSLLNKVFARNDLGFLPGEWGGSLGKLEKKLKNIISLNNQTTTNHLEKIENTYKITGSDSFLLYGIDQNISGRDAGILSFNFKCTGLDKDKLTNHFEIYYSGDEKSLSETRVVRFSAKSGDILIPLDASPNYLLLSNLQNIRIDLSEQSECKKFTISNIKLLQRKNISRLRLDKQIILQGTNKKIKPYPLTDENWIQGISKSNKNKFFITLSDYEWFDFKIGDIIEVELLGQIKILKIEKNGVFVNVEFQNISR